MAVVKKMENNQVDIVPEDPKDENDEQVKVTEMKRGFFGTVWHYATAPVRWVGRKIKESPAAAVIGGVGGAGLALGGKAIYDHFAAGKKDEDEIETSFADMDDAAADSDMDEAV